MMDYYDMATQIKNLFDEKLNRLDNSDMVTFAVDPKEGFRVEYVQNSSYAGQIIFRIVSETERYSKETKQWVVLYVECPNKERRVDNRLQTLDMEFKFSPYDAIREIRILLDELETFLFKLDDRFNIR